ncbi:hypothetical protein [Cohnella zeiphila]|uniref:Portal protein n=1 Tax=Cohnella zeiphila TaxID=2761120 RepID=A0A7X0SKY4_9BACL|nr:hypothetical protein [Cohnella zeiphila]MBB6731892.1 hypothetical protein [Cohnella zeiphila]
MAERKQQEPDELKSRFKRDLGEAKKFMEPIQQKMDRNYKAYANWRDKDEVTFKTSDLFEYVETVVPIVTNNRIRALVRSDYPDYVTHAKGLNDILDNTYDTNNWDYESQSVMRMALIYRSAFAYTGFDKNYRNGIGNLCIKKVNGRWCLVDPSAVDLEDSRFFFYVEPKRKTEVYKDYPKKKQEIEDSFRNGDQMGRYSGNDSGGWFNQWLRTVKNFLTFNQDVTAARQTDRDTFNAELSEQEKHKNVIAYIHYWYRDDKDEWRVSYWADEVFLKDEANPFWHGCLPYDIYSPVKDPMSMLGMDINEQIDTMNANRNVLMNYTIANAGLHANPPLMYNTTMGNVKEPQKLRQQAFGDGIIPINNPDNIPLNALADFMLPPTLPANVVQLFDQLGNIKDKATGVNDSFRGTQNATSGKEVQLQQEAAYTRIKTMIDQFELFNKKIAEKVIVNAMQFYTQNRGFRIKGDYTKYDQDQQLAEMNGQEMPFEVRPIPKGIDQEGNQINDRTEFFIYANPSEWTKLDPEEDTAEQPDEQESDDNPSEEEVEKAFKILQMTVEIEAGSSLPQSRLARREEAVQLAELGMIDQESVLEMYDWPDREEIIKRMQEQAAKNQEAQAQAAQADAQAKMQIETAKLQTQKEIEGMKMQTDLTKQQMSDKSKMAQTHANNSAKASQEGSGSDGNSLAEVLDKVRQTVPEAAQMSDEQLISILTQGQPVQ